MLGKPPQWKWDPIKGLSTLGDAEYQCAKPQGLLPSGRRGSVWRLPRVCCVHVALYTVHSHCDTETATVFALQTISEPEISSSLMSPGTGNLGLALRTNVQYYLLLPLSAVVIRDARPIGF